MATKRLSASAIVLAAVLSTHPALSGIITNTSVFLTDTNNDSISPPLIVMGSRSINAIIVGDTAGVTGTLNIDLGSTLNSRNVVSIGQTADGVAKVTGVGSVLNTRTLNMSQLAGAAKSDLTIDQSARVTAQRSNIGGTNTAQVGINNSGRLEVMGPLVIGGQGIVQALNASTISIGGAPPVGFPAQSILPGLAGIVTLNGSLILNSSSILKLEDTSGDSIIIDHGTLSANHSTVLAEGIVAATTERKLIAVSNNGTLTLNQESTIKASQLTVGRDGIGNATITRSSTATFDALVVGGNSGGIGSLTVDLSSEVTTEGLIIGNNVGSIGKMEVIGSTLTTTSETVVGNASSALNKLNIVGSTWDAERITIGKDGVGVGELAITNSSVATATTVDILNGTVIVGNDSSLSVQETNVGAQGFLINNGDFIGFLNAEFGSHVRGSGTWTGDTVLTDGSQFEPGASPGTATINGNYEQQAGAVLALEIAGTALGDYDRLILNGNAIFEPGSIIDIDFLNGFIPDVTDVFALFGGSAASSLDLSGVIFNVSGVDDFGFAFLNDAIVFSFEAGGVVNPPNGVPEPATPLLLMSGLALLSIFLRRQRRTCKQR
jgi:hypothetical protein